MIKKQQQFTNLLTRNKNFDLKSYILQELTFRVEVRESNFTPLPYRGLIKT